MGFNKNMGCSSGNSCSEYFSEKGGRAIKRWAVIKTTTVNEINHSGETHHTIGREDGKTLSKMCTKIYKGVCYAIIIK